MNIGFTGHRDRVLPEMILKSIFNMFPDAKWVHGGARGFDSQVEQFAQRNGIESKIIRPNYNLFGKQAPLIRNKEIVNESSLIVACYDERGKGGTYMTINYAKSQGVDLLICHPDHW